MAKKQSNPLPPKGMKKPSPPPAPPEKKGWNFTFEELLEGMTEEEIAEIILESYEQVDRIMEKKEKNNE